jgi:hypothetical protein
MTESGSWTAPAGVTAVQVRVQGAGGTGGDAWGLGTGGAAGGGGGGGAYVQTVVAVTPGTAYPVVVGIPADGGNPRCSGLPGIKGGNSSFAGVIAGGGFGGGQASHVAPIQPGPGGGGGVMSGGVSSFFGFNGSAGGTVAGSGGAGGLPGSAVFQNPPPYGMGGQGSNNCGQPAALAQPGFVHISW